MCIMYIKYKTIMYAYDNSTLRTNTLQVYVTVTGLSLTGHLF